MSKNKDWKVVEAEVEAEKQKIQQDSVETVVGGRKTYEKKPTLEWEYDPDLGYIYREEARPTPVSSFEEMSDEQLIQFAEQLGYYDLQKVAQMSGFKGKRKKRKVLIDYIAKFGIPSDFVYNPTIRGGDLLPAKAKQKCNMAYSPAGAEIYLEEGGLDEMEDMGLRCSGGWRVDNISVWGVTNCDVSRGKRTFSGYLGISKRLQKEYDRLVDDEWDEPETQEKLERLKRRLVTLEKELTTYPLLNGYKKCYCGDFKCFIAEKDKEQFRSEKKIKRDRLERWRKEAEKMRREFDE